MKITLNKDILNSIDLSIYKNYDLDIGNKYFYMEAGQEHYRLLVYLSQQAARRRKTRNLDVGTNHGCSALALTALGKFSVDSFDLVDNKKEKFSKEPITFHLKNILEYSDLSLRSYGIIFMDASKNSDFEWKFCEKIMESNWKGFLIFDDYHCDKVVVHAVDSLRLRGYPVFDLTKYGHITGTHLVDFTKNLEVIETY